MLKGTARVVFHKTIGLTVPKKGNSEEKNHTFFDRDNPLCLNLFVKSLELWFNGQVEF